MRKRSDFYLEILKFLLKTIPIWDFLNNFFQIFILWKKYLIYVVKGKRVGIIMILIRRIVYEKLKNKRERERLSVIKDSNMMKFPKPKPRSFEVTVLIVNTNVLSKLVFCCCLFSVTLLGGLLLLHHLPFIILLKFNDLLFLAF